MAHAQASVTINKPANIVFDFLADGTNNPKWRPSVTEIQKITSGPIGLGTRFKQRMKGPLGRTIAGDYEITVYEPGQILGFKVIAGPARPEGRFIFGGNAQNTSVLFDLQLPPKGFFQKLMDKTIQNTMDTEVQAITNIKTSLEVA